MNQTHNNGANASSSSPKINLSRLKSNSDHENGAHVIIDPQASVKSSDGPTTTNSGKYLFVTIKILEICLLSFFGGISTELNLESACA